MTGQVKIVLKSGKDQSLRRRHPWVFSGAIKKIYGIPSEGDIVGVYDNKDEKLGSGHYSEGSIAIRMLTFGENNPGDDFWDRKIMRAWKHRQEENLFLPGKRDVFRLVNAEGDGLPGLIIDYYNGAAVVQAHSAGMFKNLDKITGIIQSLVGLPIDTIYNKSSNTLHEKPGIQPSDQLLYGERLQGEVHEHCCKFL